MAENNNALALVNTAVGQAKELSSQIQLVSGNVLTEDDSLVLGSMFLAGMFKDMNSLFNAVVKATFGKRLGIDPMTAVTSTYVIDGKLGMEAKAIRNTLVMAGYDINNLTPAADVHKYCELEFVYKGQILGRAKFTLEDAVARGYVDPTCVSVKDFPYKHNDRPLRRYNRFDRKWEEKTTCNCKENWRAMLEEMLIARATSKGNTKFGNKAFKGEVYEINELIESPFREDTTSIDVGRERIAKATTLDELQAITKDLEANELTELMDDISAKTKELLSNAKSESKANSSSSPAENGRLV